MPIGRVFSKERSNRMFWKKKELLDRAYRRSTFKLPSKLEAGLRIIAFTSTSHKTIAFKRNQQNKTQIYEYVCFGLNRALV